MHILLAVIVVVAAGGLAKYYFHSNLHPADEPCEEQVFEVGFLERTVLLPDGSQIHYGEGPKNGQALLLIHGQSAAWLDYAAVLPELSEKFHVFAVDCYGHGASSHDPSLYSCEANGKALLWLMENVIGEVCLVSGYSSGGILTTWIAARAPEQVRGIVLEDPPFFRVTPEEMQKGASCFAWQDTFMIIHQFLAQTDETDYVVYYYQHGYLSSLFGEIKDKLVRAVVASRKEHPGQAPKISWVPYGWLRSMRFIDTYDLNFGEAFYDGSWMKGIDQRKMLQKIKCPAIYLKVATKYGKGGILYTANSEEDAKQVQGCLLNCDTITVESGHNLHDEKPDLFISACEMLERKARQVKTDLSS